VTFVLVMVGWVLFRMHSATGIAQVYAGMLGLRGIGEVPGHLLAYIAVAAAITFGLREEWRWSFERWNAAEGRFDEAVLRGANSSGDSDSIACIAGSIAGALQGFALLALGLLAVVMAFDWWVDPYGDVWKPGAVADARKGNCLVSQELIGARYYSFKLDVFEQRPTRTFVVGSSRVLKIAAHKGEQSFANLGYPGSAPETILKLFRALPAKPAQTVYLGMEAFWLNHAYALPETDPSNYRVLEYLLGRSVFEQSVSLAAGALHRDPSLAAHDRRRRVRDRADHPSIAWRVDGSRVWSWELDPKRFPKFGVTPYTGDLSTWRNSYFADWRSLDKARLHALEQALALARDRGWHVVGFARREPPQMLHVLDTNPQVAPRWHAFLRLMPRVFARYGLLGLDRGWTAARLPPSQFPDAFHSDAACSLRVRDRLTRPPDAPLGPP
jgi:hypothetical protein